MTCNHIRRKVIQDKLDRKRKELNALIEQELAMLNPENAKAYGIGSRNLERYSFSMKDIGDRITQLEKEIAILEAELQGYSRHRVQGAIPRDF